jgi:hypothetical protein
MSYEYGHGFLEVLRSYAIVVLPFGLITITPLVLTVRIVSGKAINNWFLVISFVPIISMLVWRGMIKAHLLEALCMGIYICVFLALNYLLNRMNIKVNND